MLQFNQTDTAAVLIVTLTEKVTISDPYYLFIFKHVLTKQTVTFIKYTGQDESVYPQRYNQFTINAAVVFADKPTGEWHYIIYEQVSSTNTDPALSGNELEHGKLRIDPATAFEYTIYNGQQTFTAYNG